jgi:phospholipid/cholesterol/gamma-HCH transport system ATP-binding protein
MEHVIAARFRDVYKAFGKNSLYEGLDLEIRQGEVLTILGGSGSGKSIMLKMMLGLVRADRGEVWIGDQELGALDERALVPVRRQVGMLFQGGALFDSMNVFDNVSYGLVERGERDPELLRARVDQVLASVGMPGIDTLMPSELSGGMKKRVALARAICGVPKILLYDEPTTGLDPVNVRRISELIRQLQKELGVTSVVVTHDLPSAFLISDRLALLADRRIVEIAEPLAFQKSTVPAVREFLGAMPVDARARAHEQNEDARASAHERAQAAAPTVEVIP